MTFFSLLLLKINMMQIPHDVPGANNNSPIDLTTWPDLIIYVILPVIIIILYILYRRMKKSQQ
jgi:hypothetical protein